MSKPKKSKKSAPKKSKELDEKELEKVAGGWVSSVQPTNTAAGHLGIFKPTQFEPGSALTNLTPDLNTAATIPPIKTGQ
jgi:bacteriocin-like protein